MNNYQDIEKEFNKKFCYDEMPSKITHNKCENPVRLTKDILSFFRQKFEEIDEEIVGEIEKLKREADDISEPEQHCNDVGWNDALSAAIDIIKEK